MLIGVVHCPTPCESVEHRVRNSDRLGPPPSGSANPEHARRCKKRDCSIERKFATACVSGSHCCAAWQMGAQSSRSALVPLERNKSPARRDLEPSAALSARTAEVGFRRRTRGFGFAARSRYDLVLSRSRERATAVVGDPDPTMEWRAREVALRLCTGSRRVWARQRRIPVSDAR